jgi:hypothetical protein
MIVPTISPSSTARINASGSRVTSVSIATTVSAGRPLFCAADAQNARTADSSDTFATRTISSTTTRQI